MKRLLLIGLTAILGVGQLTTIASADQNWSNDREGYPSSYRQEQTTDLAPIPEPLRYRVERRSENIEPEIQQINKWQSANRYGHNRKYRRNFRQIRIYHHYHGTRNGPGRY